MVESEAVVLYTSIISHGFMIPFFVVSAKYVMYPVQIGTGRRVQCKVQSDGIQKRIVELLHKFNC